MIRFTPEPQNLQRCWGNTKEQPATFGVQEGTGCVHAILQFTCGFLQFRLTMLVILYQYL